MQTGPGALETWIPVGGFRLDHRKGKISDGTILTTDWLVPARSHDGVMAVHPCAEQPCLHRVLADCPHGQIVRLASLYGLLTAIGNVAHAGDLPPEPVETWGREIRALRNATALWDGIAGRMRLRCTARYPNIRRLKE